MAEEEEELLFFKKIKCIDDKVNTYYILFFTKKIILLFPLLMLSIKICSYCFSRFFINQQCIYSALLTFQLVAIVQKREKNDASTLSPEIWQKYIKKK